MDQVRYQLSISDISAHTLQVRLEFQPPSAEPVELSLPAWIPGSYMIRNFAKHLARLRAVDAVGELPIEALTKQQWRLTHRGTAVVVTYQLYAFDASVRACYINDQIALINPAACCLAISGLADAPCLVEMLTVASKPEWQVATGLTPAEGTAPLGFGHYTAVNYQVLIDTPLMLGVLDYQWFELAGVRHHLVFVGASHSDTARICRDLPPICQQHIEIFGGLPADLTDYWFLTWVVDQGYGGLEHHNSTVLMCSRYDLPNPLQPDVLSPDYQTFLGLCSHEYFHTWWVKRAKPAIFQPYQLASEQYTQQLWLYEGFTSYYDDLALVRAGVIDANAYLLALAKTISRVQRAPSNTEQSLAESSFTAWTKFYLQDENAINSVVSYYAKGSLVALCLDAALRARHLSLDVLMQRCYQHFTERTTGSADDDFFQLLAEYCQDEDQDEALVAQCRQWVQEPVALPLDSALASLGVTLSYRAATSGKDLGGPAKFAAPVRDFGALYQSNAEGLLLTAVIAGTAAFDAGLMAGDLLVAIAGFKATEQNLNEMLQRHPVGSKVRIHWFRQQRLLDAEFAIQLAAEHIAELTLQPSDLANAWLNRG